MSCSISLGGPTTGIQRRVDMHMAGRAGATPAAFGIDAVDALGARQFHDDVADVAVDGNGLVVEG